MKKRLSSNGLERYKFKLKVSSDTVGKQKFTKRLASGIRGENTIASALRGKAFWGADVNNFESRWDKRTVCKAQHWQKVGQYRENYDYIISCPPCEDCPYQKDCNSDKPYHEQVNEKHEAKTNYKTHMDNNSEDEKDNSKGRTQNIYIEIMQNYKMWLNDHDNKHLGWYHPDKKGDKPKWYHFYQPIDDPEGDGTYSSKPQTANKDELKSFCEQAQEGDSLVIKNPWAYILSITATALEDLILRLEKAKRIIILTDKHDKEVIIGKLIPIIDIIPNGKDVLFTPVFREISKSGNIYKDYPINRRLIPKRMRDETIKRGNFYYLDGKILFQGGEYHKLDESTKTLVDDAVNKSILLNPRTITLQEPLIGRKPVFYENGFSGKTNGMILQYIEDMLRIEEFRGGFKSDTTTK